MKLTVWAAVESPPVHPGLAGLVLLTLAGFAAAVAYSLRGPV